MGEPQQGSAVGLLVLGEASRVLCGSCNWPCRTEHIITGLLQSPAVATGGGAHLRSYATPSFRPSLEKVNNSQVHPRALLTQMQNI